MVPVKRVPELGRTEDVAKTLELKSRFCFCFEKSSRVYKRPRHICMYGWFDA